VKPPLVPLFEPNFDEAEERAVVLALRSRWASMGPRTEELERRFAQRLGVRFAVAVSSCTAALHLAMRGLGIGPGDEVIVPSLTFVATVNCVRYVGARPVFADVAGPLDLTIDPADVESLVTDRTRAVICMHYGGGACDLDALTAICERRGIALVEDAAHAPASTHRGRPLGAVGRAGCFSFYANKNLTCAEGGLLATDDAAIAETARLLRSHGMTTSAFERAQGRATAYDVVDVGYSYRLDDIRAALALVQLDKLDADVARRHAVRARYAERLRGVEGLHVPRVRDGCVSSEHIVPVVLETGGASRRDAVRARMAERGVQTSVHYPAAHRFRSFSEFTRPMPRTEFVADHEISLPIFGSLADDAVDRVVDELRDALRTVRSA
jgi:dTDP-4-amino-4,6-dideoxygalactose transaminase